MGGVEGGAFSLARQECLMDNRGGLLTHSSPSGRFRPDKIADFVSLVNHVCALLKVDTIIPDTASRTSEDECKWY